MSYEFIGFSYPGGFLTQKNHTYSNSNKKINVARHFSKSKTRVGDAKTESRRGLSVRLPPSLTKTGDHAPGSKKKVINSLG